MHETIEHMLNGDRDVAAYFQKARDEWKELFEKKSDVAVGKWADWLSAKQIPFFEHKCGGRSLGQEVMSWSGFGVLYDTRAGFTEKNQALAKKLVEAFAKSTCSLEVKGAAKTAARSYYLDDEEDLKKYLS